MTQKGQSLIELLIAIALAAVLLPALLTGLVASREGKAQEGQRLQATFYLKEAEEALRSVREKGWQYVNTDGSYHPQISGTAWSLVEGPEEINGFSREIVISSVYRDGNGNISGSGTLDPSLKKVMISVSWLQPNEGNISTTLYLTRYLNNATLTQTTQADFAAGTVDNTRVVALGNGAIELKPGSGSLSFTDDYNNPTDYNYDANEIEVTGGFAQLKGQGSSSGSTTNAGFDSNENNWNFVRYSDNVGQTGSWRNNGGNPGGYIQINFPKKKNNQAGGYYAQSFTTQGTNITGSLTFQWTVTAHEATPDSFHLYAWVDSGLGTPVQQVWDSGNITATSNWSGTVTVDISSLISTAGTYNIKVGGYVDYPSSNKGPYTIGFDNVSLSWTDGGGSYTTDSPTIYPKNSFQPESVFSWDSFSATEVLNGGSVRYQLSDDDGASWYYHAGGSPTNWQVATQTSHYNEATTIDQKISGFPTTNGKIMVKAFLISDGSQLVKLDKITIGYTGVASSNNGTFISSTLDPGNAVAFNRLYWSENNTTNTTTKFQIAINTDNATWNFFGPDGTGSTYFTQGSGTLSLNSLLGRYFRYKILFTSTNNDLPNVTDVTVNYSP